MKRLLTILIFALLGSCTSNVKEVVIDDSELLARALSNKIFPTIDGLKDQVRMTENAKNILQLFLTIHSENLVATNRDIEYLKQFVPEMNSIHQEMLNEMMAWLYIKQIYRHEISPPVRILQREKLYLAPSNIDFSRCPESKEGCASEAWNKISSILTTEEVKLRLKRMALKDPCVNLSTGLKDDLAANRCLKKSKGNLKIKLLAMPRFSTNKWLQAITAEK